MLATLTKAPESFSRERIAAGRRRVCIVQRIVPHYRVAFFRALHATLARSGIDLELIHGQEEPGTVPRGSDLPEWWARRIRNRYFRVASQELIWQPCPVRNLASADLVIVEHAHRLLLNYPLLAARGPARRVAFWGHGANFQAPREQINNGGLKRSLARSADWWFAYTKRGAELVESYGFPRDRVTVVNNSIDSRGIARAIDGISIADREALRTRLALDGRRVGIYCGRLIEEKRLDLVWSTALEIHRRHPDFSLIVIGDGPHEAEARRMAESHDWVHYVGALSGDAVAPYFAVSDFVLMPGLVGLVVVDAFAAGLPLVTSHVEIHSPEIDYLEPGVNGLIADPDPEALAAVCVEMFQTPGMLERLRAGCLDSAGVYTLEAMVERFAGGVRAALAQETG